MRPVLFAGTLATLLVAGARPAAAQCPDGSPPPCRRPAAAPVRRADPPLDDRTWIVLPFENVARVQDIDWLRDASVNLLYLDLSRWRDIRVIDDERVADLIRDVPAQRAGPAALTLQSGLAVARRAGAGKLVMGDLLKVGARTQVVAKVFDVRSGERIRTIREETPFADSLMVIFGRLARGILAAEAPPGENLGTIGTTSLAAYRAFVAGVAALNRVDLDSARVHFSQAVEADSAFALAHYKLSVVYGWLNPGSPRRVTHAEAANRASTGLPPRERALIVGQVQTSQNRWGEACRTYGDLVRADSGDVEAWYNLGECNYHDAWVEQDAADTSRTAFRGSWNRALLAFERALELDPTYHLAYSHIPDILLVEQRPGCLRRDVLDNSCPATDQYLGYMLRDGDSLVTVPVSVNDAEGQTQRGREAMRQGVWRRNVEATRAAAERWVNAGPNEPRAHLALARALLRQGRAAEAGRAFARVPHAVQVQGSLARAVIERLELLLKSDSAAAAARFVDSVTRAQQRPELGNFGAFLGVVLGRHDSISAIFGPGFQGPPAIRRYLEAGMMTMQGAPPENLLALEAGLDSALAGVPAPQLIATRSRFLMATVPWTLELPRPAERVMDSTASDPRVRLAAAALRRDTARVRAILADMDAEILQWPREVPSASVFEFAAEGYLLLGDTTTALARLREWEARFPWLNPQANYINAFGNLTLAVQSWGRTFLRLADLAAARGDRATADRNYRRVVGLWEGASPAFQPMVRRARAALGG